MNQNLELEQQAQRILDWSRRKLAQLLPEFLAAIYLLPDCKSDVPGPLWTDGEVLYYHPETVVKDYIVRKDAPAAQLLHIMAHGLLGHIPKRKGQHPQLFDAAADLKAAAFVEKLSARLSPRWDKELCEYVEQWDQKTLEGAYLSPESREEAEELITRTVPLRSDDHAAWNRYGEAGKGAGSGEDRWAAAARQVADELARPGRGQGYGNLAGELCEEYAAKTESGVSYKEFLRRFCSLKERMEVDPNSISNIWYQLGLSLTGDAPFVEPEELREDAPALDLAVALDTSGSCCGEVMKGFLSELLAILRDAGGPRVEMTLIQCDAEIQSVQTLTREDSAESLLDCFMVLGCGGTDFRPVFEYIAQQKEDPEGKNFRGLLYLSDGCGDFPQEEPDYPVAFLFPREDMEFWDLDWCPVPDWVMQVRITPDDRLAVDEQPRNKKLNRHSF